MKKILIQITIIFILLSGCQSKNANFLGTDFFNYKNKDKVGSIDTLNNKKNYNKSINFLKFKKNNLNKNIKIAVINYPSIQSALSNLDALKTEKKVVAAQKEAQISIQGSAGATRSDSTNSLAAIGNFSYSKILYDFGSIDNSLLSQEERIRASKEQLNSQAQNIAFNIYRVLFDLNKNKKIVDIYSYGLNKSEPLINSIKNISASGYADESVILKAKKEYSELLVSNERAKILLNSTEVLFKDYFPGQNIPLLTDFRVLKFSDLNSIKKKMLKNNSMIKYQDLILKSLEKSLDSLIAQQKPNVLLQAGISSPANNPLGDASGTAGISVNYIFNDGGRIENQIKNVSYQIESAKKQKEATLKQLDTELKTVFETYSGLTKAKKSLQELVSLIKRSRETVKAQLETGKTKIQDVLNAELELAKKEIELTTINTELISASYYLKYLSENLIPKIID
ncbi:MAG: TolC family protein [Paracoccaceae bacterium]